MLYVVDSVRVAPGDADAYLALVRDVALPIMTAAGATLAWCTSTAPDLGEDVEVVVAWAAGDHARWNEIRRALVLDPSWHRYGAAAARLRRDGTRRFHQISSEGSRDPSPRAAEPRGDPLRALTGARPRAARAAVDSSDLAQPPGACLRRFEMYSLRDGAPPAAIARLRRALCDSGRFIPEVLHSAVGTNRAGGPLVLVWEHAFASPAAYQRYMVHPYHAAVLDRFLLGDSPERITTDNGLGAGLVGYAAPEAVVARASGVRRLLLLALAAGAAQDAHSRLAALAAGATRGRRGLVASFLAENTLATRWFDGVTSVGTTTPWTHVLEQGFATAADHEAYRASDHPLARVRHDGWPDGGVVRALEVVYEIERTRDDPTG